jgi:hypothetical protein
METKEAFEGEIVIRRETEAGAGRVVPLTRGAGGALAAEWVHALDENRDGVLKPVMANGALLCRPTLCHKYVRLPETIGVGDHAEDWEDGSQQD